MNLSNVGRAALVAWGLSACGAEAVAPPAARTQAAKPVAAKPVDAKPADAKPVDAKPADAKPADAKPADGADSTAACFDAFLAKAGLNEFGDAPGTLYAGGTPLFDEASGERTERGAYLRRKLPALAAACPVAAP